MSLQGMGQLLCISQSEQIVMCYFAQVIYSFALSPALTTHAVRFLMKHNPIRLLVLDISHVGGLDLSAAKGFVRMQRLLLA